MSQLTVAMTTVTDQLRADLRHIAGFVPRQLRAHRDSRRHRIVHRAMLLLFLVVVVPVLLSAPSYAGDPGDAGQIWMNWFSDKDSHGMTPGQYNLRVSQGGATHPIVAIGAFLLGQMWDIYRMGVMVVVWCLDFVLQFHVLGLVRGPATVIANVLHDTIGQLGWIGAAATLSAAISAFWIWRGRTGTGMGQIMIVAIVVALLSTAAANPVGTVTGPDGAIAKSQQLGSAITVNMLRSADGKAPVYGGSSADPEKEVQSAVSAKILDVFVRTPHQLLNYGMLFDTKGVPASCQKSYDKAMKGSQQKTIMKDKSCPKTVNDTIEHPDRSLIGGVVILPAVAFLLLFVIALLFVTAMLTCLAAYESAKFGFELFKAIFPGGAREGLATALCMMFVSCAGLVAAVIGVGIFCLALTNVFSQTQGWPIVGIYIILDLVMLIMTVGLVVMAFKAHKHGKRAGKKAANAIAPKPTPMPTGRGMGATAMLAAGQARNVASRVRSHAASKTASSGGSAAAAGMGGVATGAALAGGAGIAGAAAGKQRSKAGMALKAGGAIAKGAVAYTVGAPVAVPRAATKISTATKTVAAARKAAVNKKLDSAKGSVRNKAEGAKAYATEYKNNVAAAGRFMSGGSAAAAAALPDGARARNESTAARNAARKQAEQPAASASKLGEFNELRQRMGHPPLRSGRPSAGAGTPRPGASHQTAAARASSTPKPAANARQATVDVDGLKQRLMDDLAARRAATASPHSLVRPGQR